MPRPFVLVYVHNLMQTQNTSAGKGEDKQPQKQVGSNQSISNLALSNPVIPVPTAAKKYSSVYDIPLEQIIPVMVESKEHAIEILEAALDNFDTLQDLVTSPAICSRKWYYGHAQWTLCFVLRLYT